MDDQRATMLVFQPLTGTEIEMDMDDCAQHHEFVGATVEFEVEDRRYCVRTRVSAVGQSLDDGQPVHLYLGQTDYTFGTCTHIFFDPREGAWYARVDKQELLISTPLLMKADRVSPRVR